MLIAANPYAIRYATETRMYTLEMMLVAWGILAFRRALESPTSSRLAQFAAIVALLLYTQYWALYLVLVVGVLLVGLAWRSPYQHAARRMLLAMVVAGIAFLPWLPTFLFQRAHTGTPWGTPQPPGVPLGYTLRDFSGGDEQEGWPLFVLMIGLLFLGLFGRSTDERRIELDLHTQPGARWEAIVGGATLIVALTLNYLAGGAFQSRYSAVVFPFFVVVVARGITTLERPARPHRRASGGARPRDSWAAFATSPRTARKRARLRACCAPTRRRVTWSCTAPTNSGPRCTGSRRPTSTSSPIPRSVRRPSSTGSTTPRSSPAPIRSRSRTRHSRGQRATRSGS